MNNNSELLKEIDIEKLKELGLYRDDKLTKDYENLYMLYNFFLLCYVSHKLHLSEIEEELKKEQFIKPIEKDKRDLYHSLSCLDFFYIRNNLKLERVPTKYLDYLKSRIANRDFTYDTKAEVVIQNTYEDVLVKNPDTGDFTMTSYGDFSSGKFFAPNNAIVLGIRIDSEYDSTDDDQWVENYALRQSTVQYLIQNLENDSIGRFKLPLYVFQYGEGSLSLEEHIDSPKESNSK